MGTVINLRQLATKQNMYRLIVYTNDKYEQEASAVSINKRLAEELRKLKPTRRTMQLEKCFNKILDSLPEKVVSLPISMTIKKWEYTSSVAMRRCRTLQTGPAIMLALST